MSEEIRLLQERLHTLENLVKEQGSMIHQQGTIIQQQGLFIQQLQASLLQLTITPPTPTVKTKTENKLNTDDKTKDKEVQKKEKKQCDYGMNCNKPNCSFDHGQWLYCFTCRQHSRYEQCAEYSELFDNAKIYSESWHAANDPNERMKMTCDFCGHTSYSLNGRCLANVTLEPTRFKDVQRQRKYDKKVEKEEEEKRLKRELGFGLIFK
eukprot:gene11303-12314_t